MTDMETLDASRASTTASKSRYQWFRKSKSETDKESWQRRRAVFGSSSSTSSTAASGMLHHRAETTSSSSSHDMTRAMSSVSRLVKDAAVQCTLVTGDSTMTSHTGCDVTTTLSNEKVSSGMCADMEAVYRGTSHQRRKAIAIGATDDESLLPQHPANYR